MLFVVPTHCATLKTIGILFIFYLKYREKLPLRWRASTARCFARNQRITKVWKPSNPVFSEFHHIPLMWHPTTGAAQHALTAPDVSFCIAVLKRIFYVIPVIIVVFGGSKHCFMACKDRQKPALVVGVDCHCCLQSRVYNGFSPLQRSVAPSNRPKV